MSPNPLRLAFLAASVLVVIAGGASAQSIGLLGALEVRADADVSFHLDADASAAVAAASDAAADAKARLEAQAEARVSESRASAAGAAHAGIETQTEARATAEAEAEAGGNALLGFIAHVFGAIGGALQGVFGAAADTSAQAEAEVSGALATGVPTPTLPGLPPVELDGALDASVAAEATASFTGGLDAIL
jgi:hypothetical protein